MKHWMGRVSVGMALLCLGQAGWFVRAGEVIDANRVQEFLGNCRCCAVGGDPNRVTPEAEAIRSFLESHELLADAKRLTSAQDVFGTLLSPPAAAKELRLRDDEEAECLWFEVSLPNGQIGVRALPLVEFRSDDRGLGWLRWRSCSGGAIAQVFKSLDGASALKGLFVDLRGNPGGHLVEALAFADRFLPKGTEMLRLADSVEDYQQGRFSRVFRTQGEPRYRFPVVFITDGATASTAEAMVAVFRANWIGVSIGQRSKGDAFAYWGKDGWTQGQRGSVGLISVPSFPVYHHKGIEPDHPTTQDLRPEAVFTHADSYWAAVESMGGLGKGTLHESTQYRACTLLAQLAVLPSTK
jgi:carboxyl-terminal processing protease